MTWYFDLSELGGAVGIIADRGDEIVHTGTRLHAEPAKYRGCDMAKRLEEEYDLHLFFDDEPLPENLYTVPLMEIGGYDSHGGLIAGSPHFGLRDTVSLYYIDREKKCFLITDGTRNFMELGRNWRDGMVLLEDGSVFASYEEACKKYPILRPKDDDELMEMLKGMDEG